jgi:glycerol uptake facilitator protein
LFSVVAGFKHNGLTDGSGIWLVPVLGPIVGALLGAFVYDGLIGNVLKRAKAAQARANAAV